MADAKISALTSASTPLGGTEVLPLVQSGTTKKATIANVQEAPVVSGTANGVQYLNGSKVPTSGAAFNFNGSNLGLGATPTASPACTNFELPYGATIAARSNTAAPQFAFMSNAVGDWYVPTYKINGYATQYTQQGFDGTHAWYTAASGTAGNAISFTQRLGISQTGDVTVNNGNLVIGTAGKGIDFSATTSGSGTMTSELLSDYEEGTWTPVVIGSTVAGVGTYVAQYGEYVKIGRQVFFTLSLAWTNHTGTGDLRINGLPFTCSANGGGNLSFWSYVLGFTGQLAGYVAGSSDQLRLDGLVSGGASVPVGMDINVLGLNISGSYSV